MHRKNQNQLKKQLKNRVFLKKGLNRFLFMRGAHERVNEACKFEKIGVKRGKILLIFDFFVLKSLA